MNHQPPETPKKQITIGVNKAKGSHPNSSRSGTSTGRQLRYGHCPTCKLGILERRRNNPVGNGPHAGLWRLSCTRYSAVPPCKHYEAFHEDPAIIWQRKQNELGKGPCPECKIGKLVERIKNPFDFTEKYAECSRRGEEGGCNYRRLITNGKAEAEKKDMEMPNVINGNQDTSNMNQDASNSNATANSNHIETERAGKSDNKTGMTETAEPTTSFSELTADDPSVLETDAQDTSTATISPKNKVKITIDLTQDDDEGDAQYGSVSAVYPAQTRLFQSSALPRNGTQGMPPPKKPVSTLRKSVFTTPKGHSNTLVTPAKSPNTAGQSPFFGRNLVPAATINGLVNTPTKPSSTIGQHHPTHGMNTPVSNRPNKTFPVPATAPKKRPREEEEFDEFDDLDSDVKAAMIELADRCDENLSASNNHLNNRHQTPRRDHNRLRNRFNNQMNEQVTNRMNRNQFTSQFNTRGSNQFNSHASGNQMNTNAAVSNNTHSNPNSSWDTYQAVLQTNSQFLKANSTNPFPGNAVNNRVSNLSSTTAPKPSSSSKRFKEDEFSDFDDSDDLALMVLAEQTERRFFGGSGRK